MHSEPRRIPSGRRVAGRLRPPSSKSLTNRCLNLALLARSAVVIRHPLHAEDTAYFLRALETLGFSPRIGAEEVALRAPRRLPDAASFECGNSGTMARFLTASLSVIPGRWVVDGSPRLRERPVGPLVDALRHLGARIEFVDRSGYPPLRIDGRTLSGGRVQLDASESSQYLSALLMAALVAERETVIEVTALTSEPYVAVTLGAVEAFGGIARAEGGLYRVEPSRLAAGRIEVEADLSAACYPAAAAVLTGGRVLVEGVSRQSRQGDLEFLGVLERMGAGISWHSDGVEVWRVGPLRAVRADLSRTPDQVPTLAALAPFAAGTTRIHNVPHLRLKESDRLSAMHAELTALGVPVSQLEDGLVIDGIWADAPPPAGEVVVSSHGDHRIAMSLALVGLGRPGVAIARPEVVKKSYPGFWDDLDRITDEPS